MKQIDISVVIVGLNTRDFMKRCIETLRDSDWGGYTYEIVYVDNASRDDSVDMIRREFPFVKVIANDTNRHYCPAGNQGTEITSGRYLLYLNNDTEVEPTAVAQMARLLDCEPRAAAVGCRLLNPDGTDQWSARRFPTWYNGLFGRRSLLTRYFGNSLPVRHYLYKDELKGDKPFQVEWTGTVCMLIRREDLYAIGGLPEHLYYWHETTMCHRLEVLGRQTWIVPISRVMHWEGHGGGPRPYRVLRWHILDFSKGAYQFYCERFDLGLLSPSRWFAAASLSLRAAVLLSALWLRTRMAKQG